MSVEYRCLCGHVFKPSWIIDWDMIEVSDDRLYQACFVDCDCGRHLMFTTYYAPVEVDVEVVDEEDE